MNNKGRYTNKRTMQNVEKRQRKRKILKERETNTENKTRFVLRNANKKKNRIEGTRSGKKAKGRIRKNNEEKRKEKEKQGR